MHMLWTQIKHFLTNTIYLNEEASLIWWGLVSMLSFSKLAWSGVTILEFGCVSFCTRVRDELSPPGWLPFLGLDCTDSSDYKEKPSSNRSCYFWILSALSENALCKYFPELRRWLKHFWDFELACTLVFTLEVLSEAYFGNLSLCGDSRTLLQQRWRNILTLFIFLKPDIYPIISFLCLTYEYILHLYF